MELYRYIKSKNLTKKAEISQNISNSPLYPQKRIIQRQNTDRVRGNGLTNSESILRAHSLVLI